MIGRLKKSVQQPLKGRKHVPAILQMEAVECGAASLAMVLAYYGKHVSLEEMRESCGVSRDGSRASSILKAARKYGLEAKGFREEIETLGKHNCPCILFWNFNHFVVLTGKRGSKFCINDPAAGPREVTADEFDEAFTGVVLTFEPGSGFEKGGKRSNLFVSLYRKLGNARSGVLFAFLTGLLLVLPTLAYPAFQQVFVDKIIIGQYLEWFYPMLSLMTVSLILITGLMWLQSNCILRTNLRLSINASVQFLHHVFRLPMSFFNQRMPGELSYRVYLNDKVANLLSGKLASNLLNLLLIFFYACVMLSFDGILTVITVMMALLNLLALNLISKKRVLINQSLQQEQGKLMGTSMAGLQLIETIKATGSESNYFSTWAGHQAKLESSKQKMGVTSTYLMSLPEFLTSLNTVIILVLGSLKIMGGDLSIGMLIAYQSLVALFLAPVTKLVNLGADLQEMRVDVDRLDDVLQHQKDPIYQQETEEAELDEVTDWQAFDGAIELKDISFGYNPTAAPLITDFNLSIEPGQRVAIVGGSGSGKSSLIKLIAGLYQPWSGRILVDGKPRNEIPRHLLNLSMSMVDQDIALFEGSIRENLTMWDASLPEERIIRACRDACIHDEIAQRPGAYDDRVEENGRNFSGGQRQRLEIARALINRPSILLLDEATSALDPAMEKQIDRNIRRSGATCVIVAHRLSTIRDCDEIIVMDKGQIVERGTHEQLISEKGAYYELVKTI